MCFPGKALLKLLLSQIKSIRSLEGISGSITSTVCPDLWGMSWMGCSVSSSLLSAAVIPRGPCYLLLRRMMKIHCGHMKRMAFPLYDWHTSSHLKVDGCQGLK